MGYVLKLCNMIGGNYLIALLLFALIVEILLLPFSIKQQKNSIKQAKLRPKEMAIRKKYAGRNDQVTQQKVQSEIMDLYQKENFNPASGCLPLLIQMPILIALYNIVMNPLRYVCGLPKEVVTVVGEKVVELAEYADLSSKLTQDINLIKPIKELGLEFFSGIEGFTITELSELPNFSFFGIFDLSGIPQFKVINWLWLVPVFTFVFSLISSKVIRKFTYQATMNEQQQNNVSMKVMEYSMPLMSAWICFMVPAAIGMYWIFKQLLGMVKQIILAKVMPVPTFTEEEYKAAEREYAGKQKKKNDKAKDPNKPKVRSLHHIDDDDFEDTRHKTEETLPEPKKEVSAEEDKPKVVEKAPLKDESDRPEKK